MVLIIAEKPSLASDIAAAIPGKANRVNNEYIEVGLYKVTWALGHLLTLKEPEDYDPKFADKNDMTLLPIYFQNWGMKPRASEGNEAAKRLAIIGRLLKEAEYVIHAGDPDDEGQLLIDEILTWHHYNGRVLRLDTANTTREALNKAFRTMRDNAPLRVYGEAALARSIADFTVGINLTRFFSIENGISLPVGRVKCPTLGLVVLRDSEIENHQKVLYYKVKARVRLSNGAVIDTEYVPEENDPNLTDGMILRRAYAEQKRGTLECLRDVAKVEKVPVTSKPPLPFNLVKLQSYCSKKFGYTPAVTLSITQTLRDKYKAITYNRTDCQYLTEEHFKEAPRTTAATMKNLNVTLPELDTSIMSRCFNSKKVTTHFAIIPSGQAVSLSAMSIQERNVYTAVAQFYLAQFLPAAHKEKTVLTIQLEDGGCLRASSTEILSPGYLALLKDIDEDDPPSTLSRIAAGAYPADVTDTDVRECETKPKPRYTQASLLEDMTRIAKYVDDPKIKAILIKKDEGDDSANGSIGTDATRANIIQDLISQGYCVMDGKHIISTPKGREFYRILPDEFKKADLTAHWWLMQEAIKAGKIQGKDLTESVLGAVNEVLLQTFPKLDTRAFGTNLREPLGKCPWCKTGDIVEGKKGFGCTAYKSGCRFVIWKEQPGILSKTPFSRTRAKALINGKPVYVETLLVKKGTATGSEPGKEEFEKRPGKLVLDMTPNAPYTIKVSFEKEPLGKCPICKTGDVIEGKFAYGCSNYAGDPPCTFRIQKKSNYPNSPFSRYTVTRKDMKQLLLGKTLKNVCLWSANNNKEFFGDVKLAPNAKGVPDLSIVTYDDVIGVCPRCGGTVKKTRLGYQCGNWENGCKFMIWEKSQKGLLSKTTITPDVAQRLLNGEKVSMKNLYSAKKDKKFTGTIYLDDSKKGDYGPDIKLVTL